MPVQYVYKQEYYRGEQHYYDCEGERALCAPRRFQLGFELCDI